MLTHDSSTDMSVMKPSWKQNRRVAGARVGPSGDTRLPGPYYVIDEISS